MPILRFFQPGHPSYYVFRFTCELCATQFIHANHLKRHKKTHHSEPDKEYKRRAPRTENKTGFLHCDPSDYPELPTLSDEFDYIVPVENAPGEEHSTLGSGTKKKRKK